MASVRTSQVGVYTEAGGAHTLASQVGVYTEIGQPLVQVSQVGVYTEIGLADQPVSVRATQLKATAEFTPLSSATQVTNFGTILELKSDSVHVTQFGVLVEMEYVKPPDMATYYVPPGKPGYSQLPDITTGYQLDAGSSFWSVVLPEESRNLFYNPSYELPFTNASFYLDLNEISGWNSYERSHVYASRGFYGLLCYPDGASEGLVAQTFIPTVAGWYTFSFDLYAKAKAEYRIEAVSVDSTVEQDVLRRVTIKKSTTGHERFSMTFSVSADEIGTDKTIKCKLISVDTNTVNQFMSTDAWQVENKPYATTYFDGSSRDDSFVADPNAYIWEGQPHHSPSRRKGNVYNGGRILSLAEMQFKTTSIQGLGYLAPEVVLDALPSGEGYLSSVKDAFREFSVIGKIFGCDVEDIPITKSRLIELFNHRNSRSGQIMLRYQPVDKYGSQFGKPISIPCIYQGGLQGNVVSNYAEELELRFKSVNGRVFEEFEKVEQLALARSVLDNTFVYREPITGEYKVPVTAITGAGGIYCSVVLPNGDIVVGGEFSTIDGVPDLHNVAIYRVESDTWEQIDEYGFNDAVYCLETCFDADGQVALIAGGAFTADGATGAFTNRHLAYVVLGNTWAEVGTGVNGNVFDIKASFNSPVVYFAGDFTADGGGGGLDKFGSFSLLDIPIADATFTSYSMAFSSGAIVYSLYQRNNGNVLLGGSYTAINTDTDYQSIAEFSPANDTLVSSFGVETVSGSILKVTEDNQGTIYVGGIATKADAAGLAYWTGSGWVDALTPYAEFKDNPNVFSFDFDNRNQIHMICRYTSDGLLYYLTAEVHGNTLVSPQMRVYDVTEPSLGSGNYRKKVIFDRQSQRLMFCLGTVDNTLMVPVMTEIASTATAPSGVDVLLTDTGANGTVPQLVRLTNWVTGADLFFSTDQHLAVSDIEYTLSGYAPKMSFGRGRRSRVTTLSGASTHSSIWVNYGQNYFHVLQYTNAGVNDICLIKYTPAHWSIDAAYL